MDASDAPIDGVGHEALDALERDRWYRGVEGVVLRLARVWRAEMPYDVAAAIQCPHIPPASRLGGAAAWGPSLPSEIAHVDQPVGAHRHARVEAAWLQPNVALGCERGHVELIEHAVGRGDDERPVASIIQVVGERPAAGLIAWHILLRRVLVVVVGRGAADRVPVGVGTRKRD